VIIALPTTAHQSIKGGDDPRAERDDDREPHQAPVSLDQVINR
jgi:hypothetical protein